MKQYQNSVKTKQALADALKELMTKKPFSRITVTDIVTACGFNRKTFYYHFEDTVALLHWMLDREAVDIARNYSIAGDLKKTVDFSIRYVRSNSHILNCAYDSLGREGIKSFLCRDFVAVVLSYIEGKEKELQIRVPDDYKKFLGRMYSEAIAGTMINLFTAEQSAAEAAAADEKTIEYLTTALESAVPASLLGI